ncbi:MAG: bidirectional hydrogenase complex protein HoxE [Anaerolineae bacterium]|nr:bidirectional hydrogenase complex protein HoxE [Anaerolineae bacterium]
MGARLNKIPAPSDDKRWRIVDATMRRHGYDSSALIETLHSVQQSFGYLDKEALHFVAQSLHVPLSTAYGVATFYHFFSLKPQGKHTCVVCLGTACYIKASQLILEMLGESYHVAPGQTTEDGELSLMTARCVGSCGLAPVVVLDDEIAANLTVDTAMMRVREILEKAVEKEEAVSYE